MIGRAIVYRINRIFSRRIASFSTNFNAERLIIRKAALFIDFICLILNKINRRIGFQKLFLRWENVIHFDKEVNSNEA